MLTHEQAVALRNVSTLEWGFVVEFDKLLVGMWTTILRIETREWVRVLTDAGKAALAAYDAQWVMVRREDLEELRDTAESVVAEHTKTFEGYPDQMSKIQPTKDAIARANEALGVK